jgi:alpha-D-xyloside xylohydrolase
MMRAMIMEFPNDPACDTLDRQYMLGASLLVAPVFTENGAVDYYLPAGRWTHLLTGEMQEGGSWRHATHDFLSLPLFARPGSVVALGAVDDRPDYNFADEVTFRVFELDDGQKATCSVASLKGADAIKLTVRRKGKRVEAALSGASDAPWQLQLAGVKTVKSAEGVSVVDDPLGAIVRSGPGSRKLECELLT